MLGRSAPSLPKPGGNGENGVEKFAPQSGRVTGTIGLIVVAAIFVATLFPSNGLPLALGAAVLIVGVLMWATMLRPRVRVRDGSTLELRNMLQTIRVPLAAIDDLAVRQVLVVRTADGKRLVCPGVGRSWRQALRPTGEKQQRAVVPDMFGNQPHMPTPEWDVPYADFVELRLKDLAEEDRRRRRVRRYSPEAEALAGEVVRDRAWPEIIALVGSVVFFVVTIVIPG